MRRLASKRFGMTPISAFFFVGLALREGSGMLWATLLAAALHECGHLLAARLMKIPIRGIRLDFLGARIDVGAVVLSYGQEWLLAAAGPLFSLLLATLAAPFWSVSLFLRAFSAASLLLGILNLLPVRSFDGGRMLECFLCCRLGAMNGERIMQGFTFVSLFLLWLTAVYLLFHTGGGLSLFCFSVSLFARFLENGKVS